MISPNTFQTLLSKRYVGVVFSRRGHLSASGIPWLARSHRAGTPLKGHIKRENSAKLPRNIRDATASNRGKKARKRALKISPELIIYQ